MKFIEILLLTLGISFDAFAVMTCKGAMLQQIKKARLVQIGIIFGGWQVLVLLLSNFIFTHYIGDIILSDSINIGILCKILSVSIFCGLGVYMIAKAVKNKFIQERRKEDLLLKEIFILAVITSIDALLAGVGFAFLKIDLFNSLIPIILINFFSVIFGVYTGYYYGYEQKTKAYTVGGTMLVCISIRVLLNTLLS